MSLQHSYCYWNEVVEDDEETITEDYDATTTTTYYGSDNNNATTTILKTEMVLSEQLVAGKLATTTTTTTLLADSSAMICCREEEEKDNNNGLLDFQEDKETQALTFACSIVERESRYTNHNGYSNSNSKSKSKSKSRRNPIPPASTRLNSPRQNWYLFVLLVAMTVTTGMMSLVVVVAAEAEEGHYDHSRHGDEQLVLPVPQKQEGENHRTASSQPQVFLLTTVEGDVLALDAETGDVMNAFSSGRSLISASSNILSSLSSSPSASPHNSYNEDDIDDHDDHHETAAAAAAIFVPSLDGQLYVRRPDNDVWDPIIHIPDLINNPIQTCQSITNNNRHGNVLLHGHGKPASTTSSTTKECGIITANVEGNLLAVDANGKLHWQRTSASKPAATTTHYQNHDKKSQGPLLLLQRNDYTVQKVSTSTGEQEWNVTWGRLEAVDFLGGGGGTGAGLGTSSVGVVPHHYRQHQHHRGRHKGNTQGEGEGGDGEEEEQQQQEQQQLPMVAFANQGKTLMAVAPITGRLLWKREIPTMAASVFGINNGNWELVEVLDEKLAVLQQAAAAAASGSHEIEEGVSVWDNSNNNNYFDHLYWWMNDYAGAGAGTGTGAGARAAAAFSYLHRFQNREKERNNNNNNNNNNYNKDLILFRPNKWKDLMHKYLKLNRFKTRFTTHPYNHHQILQQQLNSVEESYYDSMWHHSHDEGRNYHSSVVWYGTVPQDYRKLTSPPSIPLLPSPNSQPSQQLQQQQQNGIFLSWPLVVALVLGLVIVVLGTVMFYQRKKKKWLAASNTSPIANSGSSSVDGFSSNNHQGSKATGVNYNGGVGSTGFTSSLGRQTSLASQRSSVSLPRCNSLPNNFINGNDSEFFPRFVGNKTFSDNGKNKNYTNKNNSTSNNNNSHNNSNGNSSIMNGKRKATSLSPYKPTSILDTNDEKGSKLVHNNNTATATTPTAPLSTATPSTMVPPGSPSSSKNYGGVGLIDGMPLIRYSRYRSEFREVQRLGKGGFGTVFRCSNLLDGREYAVKKVLIRSTDMDASGNVTEAFSQELQRVLREVKILALLDHPNIVRYYTAWLEMEEEAKNGTSLMGDYSVTGAGRGDASFSATDNFTTSVGGGATTTMSRCFSSDLLTSLDARHRRNSGSMFSSTHNEDRRPRRKNKSPNPLGWTNFAEDENSFSPKKTPTPLETLEDYGFTFDRGSSRNSTVENDDYANNADGVDVDSNSISDSSDSDSSTDDSDGSSSSNNNSNLFNLTPTMNNSLHNRGSDTGESSVGWLHATSIQGFGSRTPHSIATINKKNKNDKNNNDNTCVGDQDGQEKKQSSELANGGGNKSLKNTLLYIQMQLCSTKTLGDFLSNEEARKGRMASNLNNGIGVDIPIALNLFEQIAQAVKQIHAQGLIHRDLKPNNCFIDDSGTVKVGDFGLSRESGERTTESTTADATNFCKEGSNGMIVVNGDTYDEDNTVGVGTRSYASPEQMNGSDYDSSTDVYSLGIILFELCYPMYTGMERNIVLSRLRTSKRIFPDQWKSSVSVSFPLLHELITSMLSHHPSDRPSADMVARQIYSLLEEYTLSSLNCAGDDDDTIFYLKVETQPREDVLQCTIQRIREAAAPRSIEIVQYGLRSSSGGTNASSSSSNNCNTCGGAKAIMEFALSLASTSSSSSTNSSSTVTSSTTSSNLTESNNMAMDMKNVGTFAADIISNLEKHSEVLLARRVFQRSTSSFLFSD